MHGPSIELRGVAPTTAPTPLKAAQVNRTRWDETWHRLREWTSGQAASERLASQVLLSQGFESMDPSHPLGGPDGGKDAVCARDGKRWFMAVYFPNGKKTYAAIRKKYLDDVAAAIGGRPHGIAFVTNQELTLGERQELTEAAAPLEAELYHLERITLILDSPPMAPVRRQYLGIDASDETTLQLGGVGGQAPGAGGGGGGAIGEGARGGDGGAGGEQVHVAIGPDGLAGLRRRGFERMDIRVGKGGQLGEPGEDSVVDFVAADGEVLESVVARGGQPGRQPWTTVAGREVEARDIESGLRVTTLTLSECAQLAPNGLVNLLGAGWEHFVFSTVPFEANWALTCSIAAGRIEPRTVLALAVTVEDPTGVQVLRVPFSLEAGEDPVSRPNRILPIHFTTTTAGVWTISIRSGDFVLEELPIEIRGPEV